MNKFIVIFFICTTLVLPDQLVLPNDWDTEIKTQFNELLNKATTEGLNVQMMENKIHEGVAKGKSPGLILRVVSDRYQKLLELKLKNQTASNKLFELEKSLPPQARHIEDSNLVKTPKPKNVISEVAKETPKEIIHVKKPEHADRTDGRPPTNIELGLPPDGPPGKAKGIKEEKGNKPDVLPTDLDKKQDAIERAREKKAKALEKKAKALEKKLENLEKKLNRKKR